MDYEKKYKEMKARVLEIGRGYVQGVDFSKPRQIAEYIDPELKESEDERTRNEIIAFVEQSIHRGGGTPIPQEQEDKWITWLEKRVEQKPVEWDYPYSENETVDKLIAIAECLEMDGDCEFNGYTGTECGKFLRDLARKQVECKPADEVEPKFKVGDWITNGEHTWKVTDIQPLDYILQSQNGDTVDDTISYVDEEFHLWTIQDAKDGDVLQLQHEGIEHVIVYKRLVKKNFHTILSVHCAYDGSTNDFFEDTDSYHCITSERDEKEIHPATKEQRDTLFAMMKEAGYEWNNEKKELKKIEQTSSWSEEDEERLMRTTISFLKDFADKGYENAFECIDWIKSRRTQPKQEWSEEDERMLTRIINEMEAIKSNSSTILEKNIAQEKIDWLKSLKSHWKPSEEQMETLNEWLKNHQYDRDSRYCYSIFQSLYNDLKTLI